MIHDDWVLAGAFAAVSASTRKRTCYRDGCPNAATGYLHTDPDGFLCESHIEALDDFSRGLVERVGEEVKHLLLCEFVGCLVRLHHPTKQPAHLTRFVNY
jgi:hypothetical protein